MKNTVNEINKALKYDAAAFIEAAEKEYYSSVNKIAEAVGNNRDLTVIMLAGPSGSGKTTTAHILRDNLRDRKINTEVVSLDNFYLAADDPRVPLLSNGRPDFESVYSLDVDMIKRCIIDLTEKKYCDMPIFDFIARSRKEKLERLDIGDGVVIIEGLHALNPLLLEGINPKSILKIYISVNTPILRDDGSVALSSRQLRLVRRSSRDHLYRGSDLANTMRLWSAVVEGEAKYLYVHKSSADYQVSTLHPYEPALFRDIFLKLTENLPADTENYDYVMKTAAALKEFTSIGIAAVPWDSLIREFIPGGKYEGA